MRSNSAKAVGNCVAFLKWSSVVCRLASGPTAEKQYLIHHNWFASSQLLKCGQCIITGLHDVPEGSLQLCAALQTKMIASSMLFALT